MHTSISHDSLNKPSLFANTSTAPIKHSGVTIFGLSLARMAMGDVLNAVAEMVAQGVPRYIITANLNYAMLSANIPTLQQVNQGASFILADGMPMVWASRLRKRPLPERVTGADLLPAVCRQASELGHRVFLLGGGHGVAERAAQRLIQKHPDLKIVGILAPDMRTLSDTERHELIEQVRASSADILFCAFSQPFGETWLAEHIDLLGVPVAFQIGASMDFAAGRIRRAPKWVQKAGLEWFYRISCEPLRLTPRYLKNGRFLIKEMFTTDLGRRSDN